MKTLISDMGGVLYSFDPLFKPKKHQEEYDRMLELSGKLNTDMKSQLEAEWQAVITGLIKIYPNQEGVRNLLENVKHHNLVIVSTSLEKTSEYILNSFGIPITEAKIFNMADYGSKKDKNAWKQIFKNLPSIDFIVEDGKSNLEAAVEAAKELGSNPQSETNMVLFDV